MCCFSGRVSFVTGTNIFARPTNGRQLLVYEMQYGADRELAMILPLPVPPRSHERSVRFINLERYPEFFTDMNAGFPEFGKARSAFGFTAAGAVALTTLKVHDVGGFEASFVPHVDDFDRLDERFRISRDVWDQVPGYEDYGFAVFKLKPARDTRLHPIALEFPRRDRDRVFFPTVHVHDGALHEEAEFYHSLFLQADESFTEDLREWSESAGRVGSFMNVRRSEGIIDPESSCWRHRLIGRFVNADSWVGPGAALPARTYEPPFRNPNELWLVCTDCGLEQEVSGADVPCMRCSGALFRRS